VDQVTITVAGSSERVAVQITWAGGTPPATRPSWE